MSILDTFYLLIKSDSSQAQKDLAAVDQSVSQFLDKTSDNSKKVAIDLKAVEKELAELAAKGNKRTADENDRLNDLRKIRSQEMRGLKEVAQIKNKHAKEEQNNANETGNAFTKLSETIAAAALAYVSFGAIKAGIFNTAAENSALQVQANLLGTNAQALKSFAAASKAAGGDDNGGLGALYAQYQAHGIALPPFEEFIDRLRESVKGLSTTQAAIRLRKQGIAEGDIPLLTESDADYAKDRDIGKQASVGSGSESREFQRTLTKLMTNLDGVMSRIGEDVLPVLIPILNYVADKLGLIGAAKVNAFSGIINNTPSDSFLGQAAQSVSHAIQRMTGTYVPDRSELIENQKESARYWTSKGYSPAQVASLLAQEQAESGFNPWKPGDGGRSVGAFQWQPKRQRAINDALHINIGNASHLDNLRALDWEMSHNGWDKAFRSLQTDEQRTKFLTDTVENPKDKAGDYIKRLKGTKDFDQKVPTLLNPLTMSSLSRSSNVQVGDISVHTQATDANSIAASIGTELQKHIEMANASIDDGMLA